MNKYKVYLSCEVRKTFEVSASSKFEAERKVVRSTPCGIPCWGADLDNKVVEEDVFWWHYRSTQDAETVEKEEA